MSRKMLVDAVHPEETRVVITDHKSSILEFDFTTAAKPQIKGNVYLAKVTRVEPSLQAAFVEYGGGKQGFLPFSEIHPNYYQIPVSDRQKLIEEEEAEAALDAQEDEDDITDEEISELENTDDNLDDNDSDDADGSEGSETIAAETTDDNESVSSEPISKNDGEETPSAEEKPKRTRRRKTKAKDKKSEESSDSKEESKNKPEEGKQKEDSEPADKAEHTDKADSPETEKTDEDKKQKPRRRRGGRNRNRNNRNRNDNDDRPDVETISGEDEIEHPRRKREYLRRYKIQEVIKRNQVLLVQVVKEERHNKGVSLSSFLSLAGRYCVLMPNSPRGGGVSRKISNRDDRTRLKKILNDMVLPQGMSVIIRTAGAGHTRAEIKRDFDYLVKMWNQIREETLSASAPALVYEESNIIQRAIRDSYDSDVEEILVDGEDTFKETKAFMRKFIPSHAPKVKLYKGEMPLFHKEGIDSQLASMFEPEVRLKSGGSIVMVPTEALISIDVNSGRSTRGKNIEETAFKTNLEAAREVARQLRLRDLAGLVVIDFIDMLDNKNRRAIERAMKEALRNDRAKIQVGRISSFGLMEMSRQRMRPSIAETINRACTHCQGTGVIRSEAALSIQIIRAIEKEASSGDFDRFRISVTASEALYILNNMRKEIDAIEKESKCSIEITIDSVLHEGNFRIEKFRSKNMQSAKSKSDNAKAPKNLDENENKPSRNRRRNNKNRNRNDKNKDELGDAHSNNSDQSTDEQKIEKETVEDTNATDNQAEETKPKRRGRPRKKDKVVDLEQQPEPKPEIEAKEDKAKNKTTAANSEVKEKPEKPKRSGWWQKIVD